MVGGRTYSHQVVVSPTEELALRARADELGISVPRLLMESALGPKVATVPQRRASAEALLSASHLLGAISRNINQIAKVTNATGDVAEDLAATLAAVRRIGDRVQLLAEEVLR